MLFSGLRISEALNLKFSDLQYDGDIVKINILAKGGYYQKAVIAFKIIEHEINSLENDNNEYIFITKTGKKLTRQESYKILNTLFRKLNIKKTGCHILRHTLAINLVKQNVNITTIKDILRHSSLNETQIYAKAQQTDIQKTMLNNSFGI